MKHRRFLKLISIFLVSLFMPCITANAAEVTTYDIELDVAISTADTASYKVLTQPQVAGEDIVLYAIMGICVIAFIIYIINRKRIKNRK